MLFSKPRSKANDMIGNTNNNNNNNNTSSSTTLHSIPNSLLVSIDGFLQATSNEWPCEERFFF